MQPHIFAMRAFLVETNLVGWILDFLTNKTDGESKWHFIRFIIFILWLTKVLFSLTLTLCSIYLHVPKHVHK